MTQGQQKILVACLHEAQLPAPVFELRFAPPRRWRFDVAWSDHGVALEIEGGVWTQGRHVRGAGYVHDLEKYNCAAVQGWRVLRVTPRQLQNGEALTWIQQAIRGR